MKNKYNNRTQNTVGKMKKKLKTVKNKIKNKTHITTIAHYICLPQNNSLGVVWLLVRDECVQLLFLAASYPIVFSIPEKIVSNSVYSLARAPINS